jgi:hypothetical protein
MGNRAGIQDFHIQPYHMNGLNWRMVPDGSEIGNIVVVTGFMPAWWEFEYGIAFGTEFHTNFEIHQHTLARMASALEKRFGDLPNFFCGDDYANTYPCERRYGDGFIPALFGSRVDFEDESGHPFAESMELTDSEVERLTIPDVKNHPVIRLILDEKKAGFMRTTGELGFEGVLNIAFKLRGQEIFVDMIQKRELFHHLCDVVCGTIEAVVHLVRRWQDPEHRKPTYFVTCNCLMNMISGEMYRELLFEFDERLSRSFDLFGIHTCNWKVDPYLEVIAEIGTRLGYLDMGNESDVHMVHELFPEVRPSVFIHPEHIRRKSVEEIKREVTDTCKKLNRGYILLSDLEAGTDDRKIRAVYETAAKF